MKNRSWFRRGLIAPAAGLVALVGAALLALASAAPARAVDERLFPDGTGTITETKPSTCAGLNLIVTTTRVDDGGVWVVTQNYNGIEGLTQTQITSGAEMNISYSFPGWLMAAYNNDSAAIQLELETNRLTNRLSGNRSCPPYVPTPVAAPAVVVPACTLIPPHTRTLRLSNGDVVNTTYNFNYVEGLTKVEIQHTDGKTTTSYSFPAWLLAAYGGDPEAIIIEIDSGRLMHRRAGPC